jgi:hypothetical protein
MRYHIPFLLCSSYAHEMNQFKNYTQFISGGGGCIINVQFILVQNKLKLCQMPYLCHLIFRLDQGVMERSSNFL